MNFDSGQYSSNYSAFLPSLKSQPWAHYPPISILPETHSSPNGFTPSPYTHEARKSERRSKSSSVAAVDLGEDDRLLLYLKEDEGLSWKDIAARFQSEKGKSYQIAAFQMRYKRLREKFRAWGEPDITALKLAYEYWEKYKWEIISAKMLDFGIKERWRARYCARKWQELEHFILAPANASSTEPKAVVGHNSGDFVAGNKVSVAGLDGFDSQAVHKFASDHYWSPCIIEWLDLDIANLVYRTNEDAYRALRALSAESTDDLHHWRRAVKLSTHPDIVLYVRMSKITDTKRPNNVSRQPEKDHKTVLETSPRDTAQPPEVAPSSELHGTAAEGTLVPDPYQVPCLSNGSTISGFTSVLTPAGPNQWTSSPSEVRLTPRQPELPLNLQDLGLKTPDQATSAHIADLRLQLTLKSVALETLQSSHDSLLQRISSVDNGATHAQDQEDSAFRFARSPAQGDSLQIQSDDEETAAAAEGMEQRKRTLDIDIAANKHEAHQDNNSKASEQHKVQRQSGHLANDSHERRACVTSPYTHEMLIKALARTVRNLRLRVDALLRMTTVHRTQSPSPTLEAGTREAHISVAFSQRATGSGDSNFEDTDVLMPSHTHDMLDLPKLVYTDSDVSYTGRRAQSEPPGIRSRYNLASRHTLQTGYDPGIGASDFHAVSSSSGSGSTGKRRCFASDSADGRERNDDDQDERPPRKHRRLEVNNNIGKLGRFPCLFHVGESGTYKGHVVRYKHISQLLRHLKSHQFYACSKCLTRFQHAAEQEEHDRRPCVKRCFDQRCRRHVSADHERPSGCQCIFTSEQQWNELFHLLYPGRTIPTDLFSSCPTRNNEMPNGTSAEIVSNSASNNVNDLSHLTFPIDEALNLDEIDLPNFEDILDMENVDPTIAQTKADQSLIQDVHALRGRLQLLEQRLAQPTDREQDLEMVLANVWQASVRTSSVDAQTESPVWRLMRRFASSILSTTPGLPCTLSTVAGGQQVSNGLTPSSTQDWQGIMNSIGTSSLM